MTKLHFDYSVRPTVVRSDREQFDIQSLDKKGLRKLAKGKIFITLERPRDFAVIESEVLDYAQQLAEVIAQIDSGNHETFAVSGDYFSNNLRFTYEPGAKKLEIYEMNGGSFKIVVPYREFRTSMTAFYKQMLTDLQVLYPELNSNREFVAML